MIQLNSKAAEFIEIAKIVVKEFLKIAQTIVKVIAKFIIKGQVRVMSVLKYYTSHFRLCYLCYLNFIPH